MMSRLSGEGTRRNKICKAILHASRYYECEKFKPTALCRGSANALASPCVSVKAILTAYSRTQGEVFFTRKFS